MRKENQIRDIWLPYVSVLTLAVRSSIYKVLGILVGVTAAEAVLFGCKLDTSLADYREYAGHFDYSLLPLSLGDLIEESKLAWIFLGGMFLLTVILVWTQTERGKSRSRLLIWRLRISPRRTFAVFTVYNIVCFLMLMALQGILIVLFYRVYLVKLQTAISAGQVAGMKYQELFLVFHSEAFLHSILPMGDLWLNIRLAVALIAWGMAASYIGYVGYAAHNKRCAFLILYLFYSMLFVVISVDLSWMNFLLITSSLICIVCIGISVKGGWGYEMGET